MYCESATCCEVFKCRTSQRWQKSSSGSLLSRVADGMHPILPPEWGKRGGRDRTACHGRTRARSTRLPTRTARANAAQFAARQYLRGAGMCARTGAVTPPPPCSELTRQNLTGDQQTFKRSHSRLPRQADSELRRHRVGGRACIAPADSRV